MSEAAILALVQVALKYGWPAAIAIARGMKSATIDDAIKALEDAAAKSADEYLEQAKAARTQAA